MAVYTKIDDSDIALLLSMYDLGELIGWSEIADGIENSNFRIDTSAGSWILTLFERRVRSEDIPYFVELMHHLADRGFPSPKPQPQRGGGFITHLRGRTAIIVSFLQGEPTELPTYDRGYCLGKVMAQMHEYTTDFALMRENSMGVRSWRDLAVSLDEYDFSSLPQLDNDSPSDQPQRSSTATYSQNEIDISAASTPEYLIRQTFTRLHQAWPQNLPQGHIHADLFPDNVFFYGDNISGVIDFYFAAYDILILDLATAINSWCFCDAGRFRGEVAKGIMDGYQSVRALSVEERDALPIVLLGSSLRFYLSRLYDWNRTPVAALVRPKPPEPMSLIVKFHLESRGMVDYGLL